MSARITCNFYDGFDMEFQEGMDNENKLNAWCYYWKCSEAKMTTEEHIYRKFVGYFCVQYWNCEKAG